MALALSGRQPWWWAIMRAGKRIENRVPRSSATSQLGKHLGETIYLHASAMPSDAKKRREFSDDCQAVRRVIMGDGVLLDRFATECATECATDEGLGDTIWKPRYASLPFGAIVGTCMVVGRIGIHGEPLDALSSLALHQLLMRDALAMRWHIPGQIGHILADVTPVLAPEPCPGALGLWKVPESVIGRMQRDRDMVVVESAGAA